MVVLFRIIDEVMTFISIRNFLQLMLVTGVVACHFSAWADDQRGSAWRYTTFLIHSNGQTQQVEGRLFSASGGDFNAEIQVLNDKDEEICKGIFGSKARWFVLRQLKCLFSTQVYDEVVLVKKSKFGVVNHYVGLIESPAGQVGIVFHMGSENSRDSTVKVDLKDVEALYGKFPNWTLPKP
jgi:hypothetical protein